MNDFLNEDINDIPLGLCKKCAKCENFRPMSIWEKMPDGCGFEGWLFQVRESVKQKIRVQKEELILLEIALKTLKCEPLKKAQARIEEIKMNILVYSEHDSENW